MQFGMGMRGVGGEHRSTLMDLGARVARENR